MANAILLAIEVLNLAEDCRLSPLNYHHLEVNPTVGYPAAVVRSGTALSMPLTNRWC